ncbi:hypothetical protein [Nonomuraea sp. GTA35]
MRPSACSCWASSAGLGGHDLDRELPGAVAWIRDGLAGIDLGTGDEVVVG